MWKYLFIILILCSTPYFLLAQIEIKGTVTDLISQEAIDQVHISIKNQDQGTVTNSNGLYKISIEQIPTVIYFSHISYDTFELNITEAINNYDIQLSPKSYLLPEASVSAKLIPQKITPPHYTVKDFNFFENLILVLSYPGIQEGNSLFLTDYDGKVLYHKNLKDVKNVHSIHKGCLGNYHLIGNNDCYEIAVDTNRIELVKTYPFSKYEKYVEPCITSTSDYLYMEKYGHLNQVLSYDVFSRINNKKKFALLIQDEENIDKYYDDITFGTFKRMTSPGQKDGWMNMFYGPIYAPLFNKGDGLFLFNHIQGELAHLTYAGEETHNTTIEYHEEKNWEEEILFDPIFKKAYTLFKNKKGKSLKVINTHNGETGEAMDVDCNFIEKLVIHNNHLFYLESGLTASTVNRRLHKVRLP